MSSVWVCWLYQSKQAWAVFFAALTGIILIWAIMLVSAFVIAKRLPTSATTLDIPSFYRKELGPAGQWVATIFNLVLLYGVLVAY